MSVSQKRQIESALERAGWRVVLRESPTDQWWLDELWQLESEWSPRGATAFVSFLVDPAIVSERKPGEHVWAVGVTRERPLDWRMERSVALRPRWEKRKFEELLTLIAALREEHS